MTDPGVETGRGAYLDALFDRALELLEEGREVSLAEWPDCPEAWRAAAEEELELARQAFPAGTAGLPELAGYEVLGELGRGASGTVYLARQLAVGGRPVAIKLLSERLIASSSRRRLEAEVRSLGQVAHPNVVTVHGPIDDGVRLGFVMEWVDGPSLASLLRCAPGGDGDPGTEWLAGPLPDWRAGGEGRDWSDFVARLGATLADALAAVHGTGRLHRDVKPSNILLRADGTPVLADFGLVREQGATVHTRTGTFMGTAAYAPPEQLLGDWGAVDERSDLYSLGATIHHALAREWPLAGLTEAGVLEAVRTGGTPRITPQRVGRRAIGLARVVERAHAPRVHARQGSSADLAAQLRAVPRAGGRRPLAGAAAVAASLVAWGALGFPGTGGGAPRPTVAPSVAAVPVAVGSDSVGTRLQVERLPQVGLPFSVEVVDGAPGATGAVTLEATAAAALGVDPNAGADADSVVIPFTLDGQGRSAALLHSEAIPGGSLGVQVRIAARVVTPQGNAEIEGLELVIGDWGSAPAPTNLVPTMSRDFLRVYSTDGGLVASERLSAPVAALATDRLGRTWIAGASTLRAVRLGVPAIRVLEEFSFSGIAPTLIAIAPDDTVWVADSARNEVHQVGMDGVLRASFPAAETQVRGLAVAPTGASAAGYLLWFSSMDNDGRAELGRIDPATGEARSVRFAADRIWGIAADRDGGVWVPLAVGGSDTFDELRNYGPDFALRRSEVLPEPWSGCDVNSIVVIPDGRILCTAGDGNGDVGGDADPALLIEFSAAGEFCGAFRFPPAAAPRTVFCDGEGQVWVTATNSDDIYVYDPRGRPCGAPDGGRFLERFNTPRGYGDPAGYLQASLIFPDGDFDGDGRANREELMSGDNPFVPGS